MQQKRLYAVLSITVYTWECVLVFSCVLLSLKGEPTVALIDLRDVPLIGKILLVGENAIFITRKGIKTGQNSLRQ